jgi:hypothetical protein
MVYLFLTLGNLFKQKEQDPYKKFTDPDMRADKPTDPDPEN